MLAAWLGDSTTEYRSFSPRSAVEQRFLAEVIRDLLKSPGDIPEGEIVRRLLAKGP